MGCNCKNKGGNNLPAESELWEKVRIYAVENGVLSTADRIILYLFHDQLYNQKTPQRCTTCWDEFVKQRLVDKYIERS